MRTIHSILIITAILMSAQRLQAHENGQTARPDGHAPIGVMGDHYHKQGEWMAAYRYMHMSMDGLRSGTESVSAENALETYMMVPQKMTMKMHMTGLMWAPSDRLTFTMMIPYIEKKMDGVNRMGQSISRHTTGLGDIKLSSIIPLNQNEAHRFHLMAGISLPSGSIDESENGSRLPYSMQVGSGTYDLMPGITYIGKSEQISWGWQLKGVVHLDENDRNYTLGDQLYSTIWAARKWCAAFSTSVRLDILEKDDIEGANDELNPMMMPAADAEQYGGTFVQAGIGGNLIFPSGLLKDHRLAVELITPLYQDMNGLQLEREWTLASGWQKAW